MSKALSTSFLPLAPLVHHLPHPSPYPSDSVSLLCPKPSQGSSLPQGGNRPSNPYEALWDLPLSPTGLSPCPAVATLAPSPPYCSSPGTTHPRTFAHPWPSSWNAFPPDLPLSHSFTSFKSLLICHPLPGHLL